MMEFKDAQKLFEALKDRVEVKHLSSSDYVRFLRMKRKLTSYIANLDEELQDLVDQYNAEWKKQTEEIIKKPEADRTIDERRLLATPTVNVDGRNQLVCSDMTFFDKVEAIRKEGLELELAVIKDEKIFKAVFENCPLENQEILFEFLFSDKS